MTGLRPPSDLDPAKTLRWMRRGVAVVGVVTLVNGFVLWLLDSEVWWLVVGSAVLMLLSLATLGPTIRRAERRGPLPADERSARIRRGMWVAGTTHAVTTVVASVIFAALVGIGPALIFAALLFVVGGVSLGLSGRMYRQRSGSPPE